MEWTPPTAPTEIFSPAANARAALEAMRSRNRVDVGIVGKGPIHSGELGRG